MAIGNAPRRSAHAARVVAIDIGLTAVRAVEVERRGEDVRLLKRGLASIPAGCWDDLAGARDRLIQAVRAALSAGGITATQVAAALPRRLVTLKYARLPHATPEQVRGMVQFEAQQYIPFPLDEVVLDHQIVSDETDEMTMVMIVAARRTLVDNLLAVFDKAGLEVTRLSVSALALAEHAQDGAEPLALLDVEPGEMDLAVVSDGRLLFTRAAALGEMPDNLSGSQILADEVTRSLAAYQNEHRALPVSRLLVAAPSGEQTSIEETLGGLLDVPVGRLNGRLLPAADPDALGYATVLGLALAAEGRGISRINLIPAARAERRVAARRRANTLAVAIVVVIAAALAGIFLRRSLAAQQEEYLRAARENRKMEAAQRAIDRVKQEHDRIAQTYQTLSGSLARGKPAVDVVKAVSDAVPKATGIYLTQFTFERNGNIALHGSAKDETAATDFVLALQSSGAFADVRLGYLSDMQAKTATAAPALNAALTGGKSGGMNFLISCRLQDKEGVQGGKEAEKTKAQTVQNPKSKIQNARREGGIQP